MEFSRIGTHTIRCVITEEEIKDLGYTLDDILSNAERTQEFMNHIFDLAEVQFGMKFEMGVRSVRADFLPDHTISLTFSENQAQQKVNDFMGHLLDYVNEMIGVSKEKLAELKLLANKEKQESVESASTDKASIIVLLQFLSMDVLCRYAKNISIERIPNSKLFKYKEKYYLLLDLDGYSEEEVLALSVLTDEYASNLLLGADKYAFMKEHAELIIDDRAIETLKALS